MGTDVQLEKNIQSELKSDNFCRTARNIEISSEFFELRKAQAAYESKFSREPIIKPQMSGRYFEVSTDSSLHYLPT